MNKLKYIFINHDMSGVGGGQRYVLAKAQWLILQGWDVLVCHIPKGKIILDHSGIIYYEAIEMLMHPRLCKRCRKVEILEHIRTALEIYKGDTVVVESANPNFGLWGELIAEYFFGKHLCFCLEENPRFDDLHFLRYLVENRKVAFITESVAEATFNSYAIVANSEGYCLSAYNPSPIKDVPWYDDYSMYSFRVGAISRLEKPYIEKLLDEVVNYCHLHLQESVLLLLIGDTNIDGLKDKILDRETEARNLKIRCTGFMHPIPRDLIMSMDVMVCKAGSASVCANSGALTIRYGLTNDLPEGFVYYYDQCLNELDNKNPQYRLVDLFEFVKNKSEFNQRFKFVREQKPIVTDYEKHFGYLSMSRQDKFYDVESSPLNSRRLIISLWVKIFRNDYYQTLYQSLKYRFDLL